MRRILPAPFSKIIQGIPILYFLLVLVACQPTAIATPNPILLTPTPTSTQPVPSATSTAEPSLTPTPFPSKTPTPDATLTEKPTPSTGDLQGIWERITDDHGNEYLFFGEDGTFVYAEGNVENVEEQPSLTGSFQFEAGIFTLHTEDCPEITGTYTIRLLADKYLTFELVDDPCEGRVDGLTFQSWVRYEE